MVAFRVLEDTIGRDAGDSDSGERTYTRVFTVETTQPIDDGRVILTTDVSTGPNSVPQVGEIYIPANGIADFDAWCTARKVTQLGSRTVWRVIASYSNRQPRPDENLLSPEQRRAVVETDTITSPFAIQFDANGQPIRNTARDPFDPAITDEESWMLLRVTKNVRADVWDPRRMVKFENKLNSEVWNGFNKKQVKCRKIRATSFFEAAQDFHKVTMEFEVREARIPFNNRFNGEQIVFEEGHEGDLTDANGNSYAWVKWVLNRGYRQLVDGRPQPCKDANSKLVFLTPSMLDMDGRQLSFTGTPIYLGFEPYKSIDFEALQIELNFPD